MIQVFQRLHSGIYKSCGGGETVCVSTYNVNARNLIKAIKEEKELFASNTRCYGNIGRGKTWIEINEQELDEFETSDILQALNSDKISREFLGTATENAQRIINRYSK